MVCLCITITIIKIITKRALVKLQVLLLFYTKELNLILEIRFVLTYLKKKRVRLKKKE